MKHICKFMNLLSMIRKLESYCHFLLDKNRIGAVMPRYGAAEDEGVYYAETDYNEARYDLAIYS